MTSPGDAGLLWLSTELSCRKIAPSPSPFCELLNTPGAEAASGTVTTFDLAPFTMIWSAAVEPLTLFGTTALICVEETV